MTQDPNFLRRQREKREAQKKALPLQPTIGVSKPLITPQTRQQAIDAHVQELLNKQAPPPPPAFPTDEENT